MPPPQTRLTPRYPLLPSTTPRDLSLFPTPFPSQAQFSLKLCGLFSFLATVLGAYFWLCAQRLFLAVLGGPHGVSGIDLGLTVFESRILMTPSMASLLALIICCTSTWPFF